MEGLAVPPTLQDAMISSLPTTGFYLPNFITSTEESHLLDKVCYSTKDKHASADRSTD